MNVLKFSIKWRDDALNVSPQERATIADFAIWIDDQNATMHLRGNDTASDVTISLYSIAEGLAHDWWTLFGARDHEVSLLKYRNGFVVPDIRMSYDGEVFHVHAKQSTYTNPDIRFWAGQSIVLKRKKAEEILSLFIEEILHRLSDKAYKKTSAHLRWARVQDSRSDPDYSAFCEAAGALGLDPYNVSDEISDRIVRAGSLFKGEPLTDFLAGASNADTSQLLDWVETVDAPKSSKHLMPSLRSLAKAAEAKAPHDEYEPGWRLGYRRANAMRNAMNVGSTTRIKSIAELSNRFESQNYELSPTVDGLRALRSDHEDGVHIHVRDIENSPSINLFSFARAVGDVACFPNPGRAPINELKAAYRQAAGRAFAAEFLAPITEIQSMLKDGRDTFSIAQEFSVSPFVINHQIDNAKRIQAIGY